MNYVDLKVENRSIPCERYSRTSGYFGSYDNLNLGKKSERDERVYYKVPENIND